MWLAIKNNALSAYIFDEVVVFNNGSVLHVFFFWKTLKACLLMQGAWSPCGEAIWRSHCWLPHNIQNWHGEECESSVAVKPQFKQESVFSFQCSFLFVGSLSVFCCFFSAVFQRSTTESFVFLHILARVSLWAYQNCDWDKCAMWERGTDGSSK